MTAHRDSFSLRGGGLVLLSSDQPGNHATMYGPSGHRLHFRADACAFSDAARSYTWAFQWSGAFVSGQRFVFATSDRQVVGEVGEDGQIQVVEEAVHVPRGEGGKPAQTIGPQPIRRREEPIAGKLVSIGRAKVPTRRATTSVRCLFVNPSVPYNQWGCYRAGVMNEGSFSSHGMAYVSATLKSEGHECWLVDLRSLTSWAHTEQTLRAEHYDVAFVGFLSIDAFNAACVVRLLKELHPDRPVVVGGLHVSIAKEGIFPRPDLIDQYCFGNYDIAPDVFKQFLAWKGESRFDPARFPLADYVILDDGEIAARDLVAELAAGRRPASRTIEGGAVPMEVARHLDRDLFNLDVEAYSPILPFQPVPMVTVTWARGCSYRCTYSVTGDTLVFTDDGPVEIASLARGIGIPKTCPHGETILEYPVHKMVATPAGRGLATVALAEGVRPVLRVTAENGASIKATPEHKFLCVRDGDRVWKRADELRVGDEMVFRLPDLFQDHEHIRVRSVEQCLTEPVYDLTVPGEEAFVANGFVAHNCNLSSQLSNTNVRTKPVELVEEELDMLHRRFGGRIGSLMIHDDLTFHIRHIAEWCELILRKYGPIPVWMQTRAPMIVAWYHHRRDLWETLCRAGLVYVSVGFESGSQRVLDYMKKDATVEENIECGRILDEYGINSFANFLWGVPSETNEEAEQTVELVQKIRPGFLSGSVYCSYPGTAQDRECREKGFIVPGSVYTRSHLPWQYTIKGIDYAHRYDCLRRAGQASNYLRMPKLLSEDRKRELAASSRGLQIH